MDKYRTLKNVYNHPLLTEDDIITIVNLHKEINFSKGDYYLKRGEQSDSYLILDDGLMRSFVFDYDGNEITTNFFTNNDVVIEVLSLFKKTPSQECIHAITDSTCWKIDVVEFENLFHSI